MGFMTDKFKGVYRLKTPYDATTNDFPRDIKGSFSDYDIYIDCMKNTQVCYYGRGVLECYIPSLGRGHNIIKAIYSDNVGDIEKFSSNLFDYDSMYHDEELNKIIYDIYDTDEEVVFKFKWDKMKDLEKYLQPKTSGADRSPFSTKNLPKSPYAIPNNDLDKYKTITNQIPKENILKVGFITTAYIKTLGKSKKKQEEIKADMKKKMLKGKEYIHSIGKWDDYLKYLEKEVKALC